MKLHKLLLMIVAISSLFVFTQCERDELLLGDISQDATDELLMRPADVGGDEGYGNCLSFPVIWSDGDTESYKKVLRGDQTIDPVLNGDWYYVWGEDPYDPQQPLYSDGPYANDATPPLPEGVDESELYKAFIQKDENNVWQAWNEFPGDETVVDYIDWGDNLESIDWSLKSQVRTEVVLYKVLDAPVTQYAMRHCDSWGIDEVHGLQTELNGDVVLGPGDVATVYSPNARLTIQKFSEVDTIGALNSLKWDAEQKVWTNSGKDIINEEALFNMAVWQAADGPGYYNAEVNVKGKVIYGYTWNLRKMNEGEGFYRITFSFDEDSGLDLFTAFDEETYVYVVEEEEEITTLDEDDNGSGEGDRGGQGKMDHENNLTYMDILITEKTRGGGRDGVGNGGNSGSGVGGGNGGNVGSGGGSGSGGSGGSGHNGGGGH